MTVEKSKGQDQKMPPATKKVAPDGGWAWMVCLGVSLVNVSCILLLFLARKIPYYKYTILLIRYSIRLDIA